MVYVDQDGNRIENPDLSKGFLVDREWIDHPGKQQQGHFEYERLPQGGIVQVYVVDEAAQGGWREVTVQTYIPYPEEDENAGADTQALEERIGALEETVAGYEAAYAQGVEDA